MHFIVVLLVAEVLVYCYAKGDFNILCACYVRMCHKGKGRLIYTVYMYVPLQFTLTCVALIAYQTLNFHLNNCINFMSLFVLE